MLKLLMMFMFHLEIMIMTILGILLILYY